jgi:hypothetical protein
MDAPPLPSERQRELAALRSRAYGPDADINGDADALARLIELEEMTRARGSERTDLADRDAGLPPAGALAGAGANGQSVTAVLIDDDVESSVAVVRPWWRRVPLVALIAAAGALGLAVGFIAPMLGSPGPVTTLERAPIDGAPLDFGMYGVRAESPVRYEPFHNLEVWSAQTPQGSTCIVVASDTGEWVTTGCAPEPLQPTADVTFFEGMRSIDGLELPDGSLLRFVLRDDVMEIWIAETVQDT